MWVEKALSQEGAMPKLFFSLQWTVWAVAGWRLVPWGKPALCNLQQRGSGPAGAVLHQRAGGVGAELKPCGGQIPRLRHSKWAFLGSSQGSG